MRNQHIKPGFFARMTRKDLDSEIIAIIENTFHHDGDIPTCEEILEVLRDNATHDGFTFSLSEARRAIARHTTPV